MQTRTLISLAIVVFLSLVDRGYCAEAAGPDAQRKSLFDPARHMRIADVKPGMKGYGLSVFSGTEIEKFNVQVISVLSKFNPKHDVILVRCSGANLEHTGSIAGMSGSPIFLTGEDGKDRLVGAFAYGWPMMKDPVGGVQPIEYMLQIPTTESPTTKPTTRASASDGASPARRGLLKQGAPMRWSIDDVIMTPWSKSAPRHYPFASIDSTQINPRLELDDLGTAQLRAMSTPLMTSGLSTKSLQTLQPIFNAYGMTPLQAGTSAPSTQPPAGDVKLERGSVLALPLLTGDVDMTAVGTCTEVIDGKVFGFGHPFMSQGSVSLPVGPGYINAVIANLMTSFKLGAMTEASGGIYSDELTGVAGSIGKVPTRIPIDVQVKYTDGTLDESYHFLAASHPRFTPILAITAISSAITGEHDLPEFHTMKYDLKTTYENGRVLEMNNVSVNADVGELFFELGGPMMAAAENPFERVLVKSISGTITVQPEAREARILSVNVPRLKHRPGETVKGYVNYRPFRGEEAVLPIEFQLPKDLHEGQYQLSISDWMQYFVEEQTAKPFRFTAESIDEIFDVMKDIASVRHDAIYVRLNRQADGIAIGRTAMPNLPSSRREVLLGAGRSNMTAYVSATVKSIPTPYVMSGAAQFTIEIDRNARVEVAGARGSAGNAPKPESPVPAEPTPAPTPSPEPSKPKPKNPTPAPGVNPDNDRQGDKE